MISYIQNSHLRNRRACVDIAPEFVAQCVPVLVDAGFRIVGSATTRGMHFDCVRLIIEGDALPEGCEGELRLVTVVLHHEQYGSQKVVRVQSVELVADSPAIAA